MGRAILPAAGFQPALARPGFFGSSGKTSRSKIECCVQRRIPVKDWYNKYISTNLLDLRLDIITSTSYTKSAVRLSAVIIDARPDATLDAANRMHRQRAQKDEAILSLRYS